jgi:hypothetical protein
VCRRCGGKSPNYRSKQNDDALELVLRVQKDKEDEIEIELFGVVILVDTPASCD